MKKGKKKMARFGVLQDAASKKAEIFYFLFRRESNNKY